MTIIINGSGQITGSDSSFQTGDFLFKMRATAPTGWIAGDGSTIGAPGSGATRASADTLALFTLWWSDFSDALLPIFTSTGAASTRGVSAAADWAALKRLTVFDLREEFVRGGGGAIPVGTKQVATSIYGDTAADAVVRSLNAGNSVQNHDGTSTQSLGLASITGSAAAANTRTFYAVRPRNVAMLPCFKL